MRYHYKNFSILTTHEKMDSDKIWRVWLKNWTCHAHLMFLTVLAGNPNFVHQKPSYLVQSGFPLSLTTGENLVVISQTISEKFKINRFVSSIYSPRGNKIIFKNYFITSWGIDWKDKTVNFEFLRDGLRYHHQIFTSSLTLWEPALYQIWRA